MYSFSTTLSGDFDDAIDKVTAALKAEGFGVLTDIDVQQTMQTKLGVEMLPYRILGACNPGYANRAIEADPDLGLLLPCNVVVRQQQDGNITVAFMDPAAVLGIADNDEISSIGGEVRQLLQKVMATL